MKTITLLFVNLISIGLWAQGEVGESDTALWETRRLDNGRQAAYLSSLEKDVLLELNKVRSNPRQYARLYVAPMLKHFNGKLFTPSNIETKEGVKAVNECIRELEKTPKLDVLMPDQELYNAAFRHTSLQSKTTEIGHDSPNGETFEHRLRKLRFSNTAECISYGENDAAGIVISLLVDDGVSSRGHRRIILNPRLSAVGISAGGHKAYSTMCTLDFGGGKMTGR